MIMDQDATWEPWQFQLAKANWWAVQEPASEACCPAAGLPVEYDASVDMSGTCSLPGGQHLVECHYYSAASQPNCWQNSRQVTGISSNSNSNNKPQQVVDSHSGETDTKISNANSCASWVVLEEVESQIEADLQMMEKKMHRFPAGLQGVDERYTVPRYVAIGPYHHHRLHLNKAEKVKHAAAIRCVRESDGHTLEEMFFMVASAADSVRQLYDEDVMAGISYQDFRHMMFFDACFLVQYMVMQSGEGIDQTMRGLLSPNRIDIHRDVRLLENQIPWKVVETVMAFRPVQMQGFLYRYVYLQDLKNPKEKVPPPAFNTDYEPAHLLGLLRYYSVGRTGGYTISSTSNTNDTTVKLKSKNRSVSVSALELAEMGIRLRANKSMELSDMGLVQEGGALFPELSLAPLILDRDRASYLVNMAALELCTVKSFSKSPVQDSVVCSYLMILALLVNSEEDVQQLRVRGLLKGGGGLTNEEALHFFTSFQGLRLGPCYTRVINEIENYREKRRMQTKLYAFWYNNKKIIAAVITGMGALVGVIGTLLSIKKSL